MSGIVTTVAGGKDDVHAPNLPDDDPKPSAEGKLILMMMFKMFVIVMTLVMEMKQKEMLLIRNPMSVTLALVVTMNTKGSQGQSSGTAVQP